MSALVGTGALTLGFALSGMVGLNSDLHAETVRSQQSVPAWNDGEGASTYVRDHQTLHRHLVVDSTGAHWVFCTPEEAAARRALHKAALAAKARAALAAQAEAGV